MVQGYYMVQTKKKEYVHDESKSTWTKVLTVSNTRDESRCLLLKEISKPKNVTIGLKKKITFYWHGVIIIKKTFFI